MSGDTLTFPSGRFDDAHAPPLLFVHGTADTLVPYESSVDAFNQAQGPKGLITVIGGGHGATVDPTGKWFTTIVRATTDFWDVYLKGDTAAATRIGRNAVRGVTNVVFTSSSGSHLTLPTTPAPPARVHHASASSVSGLTNGESVTVQWSDFTPGNTVNVVECSKPDSTDVSSCDLKHAAVLQPDPTGSGQASIDVVSGAVGTGVCDAAHPDCVIVVNDGGSLDRAESVRIPISFVAGSG